MPATRKSYRRSRVSGRFRPSCRRATKSLHRRMNVVSPSVRGTTNTAKYTFTATHTAKFAGRRGKSVKMLKGGHVRRRMGGAPSSRFRSKSAPPQLAAQPQLEQWGYMEKKSNKGIFSSSKWQTRACVLSETARTLKYYDISKSGVKTFKNTLILDDLISWSWYFEWRSSNQHPYYKKYILSIDVQFLPKNLFPNRQSSTVTYHFQRAFNLGPTKPGLFPHATYTDTILDDLYQYLTNECKDRLLIFGCKYKHKRSQECVHPLYLVFGPIVVYTSPDSRNDHDMPLAEFLKIYQKVPGSKDEPNDPRTGENFLCRRRLKRRPQAFFKQEPIFTM